MEEQSGKDIAELNKIYSESETCDKVTFAEQRSNCLLVAGEHYTKNNKFFDRIRSSHDLSNETKIRLTKNHTQKIVKIYANEIVSAAPNVKIVPQLDSELQDRKSAEMHDAVWKQFFYQEHLKEKIDEWADDFSTVGEVATKLYFDKTAGEIKGYEPLVDESGEQLMQLESGETITAAQLEQLQLAGMQISATPAEDKNKPIYTGQIKAEELYGFNLLRDPEAKTMAESSYLVVRKMAKTKTLKKMFPEKESKINTSSDKTFLVFDNSQMGYRKSESNETMVKEFYFRKCPEYPNGYYYITTEDVILEEGELPFGIFPIVVEVFDRVKTTPRGFSIVKTLRPYQIEINRCASKIAEHQITLGDDKLITLNGSKASSGATLPGVRVISVTGQAPVVMEGRNGMQYAEYMASQIDEMYNVAMVNEITMPNSEGQFDVFAMLFQAAKKKKAFQRYVGRFSRFLTKVCELYIEMARKYLPDDAIIMCTGKKEQVNIAEFKRSGNLEYQIKIEESSQDAETLIGKQMVMSQITQFVGPSLSQQDLGKVIKNMPYANFDETFDDLTIDYENASNLMLALERGEFPESNQADNAEYMMKKLNQRMKQADFAYLHDFVKGNYQKKFDEYSQILEAQRQKVLADNAGLIPTTGASVGVDIYVAYDPQDPTKSRRARIPYDAVKWLMDKLETQGTTMQAMDGMPLEMQARMPGPQGQQQMEEAQPPQQGSVQ